MARHVLRDCAVQVTQPDVDTFLIHAGDDQVKVQFYSVDVVRVRGTFAVRRALALVWRPLSRTPRTVSPTTHTATPARHHWQPSTHARRGPGIAAIKLTESFRVSSRLHSKGKGTRLTEDATYR